MYRTFRREERRGEGGLRLYGTLTVNLGEIGEKREKKGRGGGGGEVVPNIDS